MIFRRFEDDGLSHFSYLIGGEATREAAVVDPRRDVDSYLEAARDAGVRIAHVLETHIHADYASGALDLAERSGARLWASAHDEGERYETTYVHRGMSDGDEVDLGDVRLRAVHSPGHTPEHVSFLVFDDATGSQPVRFLTGDFLLIGSVGRPDLLGEDQSRGLAGSLYDALADLLPGLPDELAIHPAHGAGSMCGAGMGDAPESTLGAERAANPYLDPALDREAFVRRLLDDVPPYPDYYRRMKERNAGGVMLSRSWPEPVPVPPGELARRVLDGQVVVDTRHQLGFGGGHVPGSIAIGLDPDLSTWAGWTVPYDRPILLVVDRREQVPEAVLRLARVGLDHVDGFLEGGMDAWLTEGRPIERVPQWTPRHLADRLAGGGDGGVAVVDVRTEDEWAEGHIAGATHRMAGYLAGELDGTLPTRLGGPDREVAVVCSTGYRSTVAASLLLRHGYHRVRNVPGGMTAWEAAGLPVHAD